MPQDRLPFKKAASQPSSNLPAPIKPRPGLYTVILHNDPALPGPYLMSLLIEDFRTTVLDARLVIYQMQHDGCGAVGSYPADAAETKARNASQDAYVHGYYLDATYEKI